MSWQVMDHPAVDIFFPDLRRTAKQYLAARKMLSHYTTADAAMKILDSKSLWFRNAKFMNDFSEIRYGLDLLKEVMKKPIGAKLRSAIDSIYPNTTELVLETTGLLEDDWKFNTFIACPSLHKVKERKRGRLSMWRAYGNIAIIMKAPTLMGLMLESGIRISPMRYFAEWHFMNHISKVSKSVEKGKHYLEHMSPDVYANAFSTAILDVVLGTKHPSFSEEQECRLIYRPNQQEVWRMQK